MSLLLQTDELTCGYGPCPVLQSVSLSLESGARVALLGPNGSGKSTLLKTLCREIPMLSGKVRLGERELRSLSFSEMARQVAYVPQEEIPPFRFSVRQVVVMGRLPHSEGLWDSAEDHQLANQAMELADCLHLAERAVTEISGGERQRVLIARALAQQASVLLLDEPTSHLDVGHQMAVVRLVRRLAEEGRAILAAVHDLNMASLLADFAVLLHRGRVGMAGPCEEVLRSALLDEVYGVRFRRLVDEDGALRVFPATQ